MRFLPRFLAPLCLLAACGGAVDAPTVTSDAGADTSSSADGSTLDGATSDTRPTETSSADTTPADTTPPDTGALLTETCAGAGGKFCTAVRWELCPSGYEPVGTGDGHYDCGKIQGWCCVPAPASTCSSSGKGNCVPGGCTGCWAKVEDPSLTCEDGRGCCIDMCD
ncbi:MAG: hypothetical protein ABI175_12630 [Polyangiales bacterium]